jgi:hypothetical protein
MTQTGPIDETKILENRRACAKREIECKSASLFALGILTKADIRAAIETHLQTVEGGTLSDVLTRQEVEAAIQRGERAKPKTRTASAAQSGPVEVVGKPETVTAGGALSLNQFMTVERPPLQWVVEDILPQKGRALLTASAKSGKTFFALELGLSVAAGVDFLGLRIPSPQRVLYCQSELSDALLTKRLGWIRETMPFSFPWELAGENFLVVENDPVRVSLADDAGRARIEDLIEKWKPDLLVLDPLYDLFRGIQENDAAEVGLALGYVSSLAARGPAVLLVHHHGKGGASRGSSVFQGWSESDLSMSPAGDDCLRIDALLRCAFGAAFPMHVRRPFSEGRAWFEPVPEGWTPPSKQNSERVLSGNRAVAVLSDTDGRGMRHGELTQSIIERFGVSECTAKNAVRDAKNAGTVQVVAGIYYLPGRVNGLS